MKIKKDMTISDVMNHYYIVNDSRCICILTTGSREIYSIGLIDARKADTEWLEPKGLWYLENVAEGDDCEVLNIDSLMTMIAQEEHGCVRA